MMDGIRVDVDSDDTAKIVDAVRLRVLCSGEIENRVTSIHQQITMLVAGTIVIIADGFTVVIDSSNFTAAARTSANTRKTNSAKAAGGIFKRAGGIAPVTIRPDDHA